MDGQLSVARLYYSRLRLGLASAVWSGVGDGVVGDLLGGLGRLVSAGCTTVDVLGLKGDV